MTTNQRTTEATEAAEFVAPIERRPRAQSVVTVRMSGQLHVDPSTEKESPCASN